MWQWLKGKTGKSKWFKKNIKKIVLAAEWRKKKCSIDSKMR